MLQYVLSQHATKKLQESGRSQIKEEWIRRALTAPDYSDEDPRTNTIRVCKRIPEYEN